MEIVREYWWVGLLTVPLLAVVLRWALGGWFAALRQRKEGLFRDITRATCPGCTREIRIRELERRGSRLQPRYHCPHCEVRVGRDRASTALMTAGTLGSIVCTVLLPAREALHPTLHAGFLLVFSLSIVSILVAIGRARLVVHENRES